MIPPKNKELLNILRSHLKHNIEITIERNVSLKNYYETNAQASIDEDYIFDLIVNNYEIMRDSVINLMSLETDDHEKKRYQTFIEEIMVKIDKFDNLEK